MCIQLEQQVSNHCGVSWEFIIPQVTVFQQIIILNNVKDRGEEGFKRLCFVYVPICKVNYPTKDQCYAQSFFCC